MHTFVTKHPVLSYYLLTFTISWGGVLLVIAGSGGTTGVKAQDNPLFPLAVIAMVAGPSVAGILLTRITGGRAGVRELVGRLLTWRVPIRWYAVALLAAPALTLATLLTLWLVWQEHVPAIVAAPDKSGIVLLGTAVALVAGFFEELGWTGFVIPRLKRNHGVLATGLIVGLLWSAWHVLVVAWGMGGRSGTIPIALFIAIDALAALPAFRVLMVWVYDRTESLLIAMLMHASLTATTIILAPAVVGGSLLLFGVAFAASIWIVIAALALRGSYLSREMTTAASASSNATTPRVNA